MTVWTVPARIVRVVDGDTLAVTLDLGWHITYATKVRLAGCNAPERKTPTGEVAYWYVVHTLWDQALPGDHPEGPYGNWRPITVMSHSLDKYGRVLGTVMYHDADGEPVDLAHSLLAAGHAVPA